MTSLKYEIIIEPDGDSFHGYCPTFPGLHTCGKTEEETLANVITAIKAYRLSLLKHGVPVPISKSIEIPEFSQ